jgi:3-hydroxyacyl-[acyl-carrier-protein] dehydratase
MRLLGDFFKVNELKSFDKGFAAEVEINAAHSILKGHFPGNPVVPGVCMIEIVKEILEQKEERTFLLSETKNAKFLNILNPEVNPKVTVKCDIADTGDDFIRLRTVICDDEKVYLKLDALFTENR